MAFQSSHLKGNKLGMKFKMIKDDSIILGNSSDTRMDNIIYQDVNQSLKSGTQNSCWTPINHKPSNQQLFKERADLICHWFDMWTNSQRHQFLRMIFSRCNKLQYHFVQNFFNESIPLHHLDFTRVLPRFLSLYIFSFLEPKSLSRSAQVCWYWKFLTEQDVIWMPKCLMRGWFLPYTPLDNEYGAWKRHYLFCVDHFDYEIFSRKNAIDATKRDQYDWQTENAKNIYETDDLFINSRPRWKIPDSKPKDLEKAFYAFVYGPNLNSSKLSNSPLAIRSHWGRTVIKGNSYLGKTSNWTERKPSLKNSRHKIVFEEDNENQLEYSHPCLLFSDADALENLSETRLHQLVGQPWEINRQLPYGIASEGTNDLNNADKFGAKMTQNTLRIILISSHLQATELLQAATKSDVLAIIYEYESHTIENIRLQVENILDKRHVRSIGLFCHEGDPGVINLVEGCQISSKNFYSEPRIKQFFISLSSHILPNAKEGQFHIFTPLAASEDGMDLISDLTTTTGIVFSSPTSIVENHKKILGNWLYQSGSDESCPSLDYFCENKLNAWIHTAKHTAEAIKQCKLTLAPFFNQFHQDIVAKLTGEIIFDIIGRTFIYNVNKLITVLTEGLSHLGQQKNVNYLEFLGRFFHEKFQAEEEKIKNESVEIKTATNPVNEDVVQISDAKLLEKADSNATAGENRVESPIENFEPFQESFFKQNETEMLLSNSPTTKKKKPKSNLEDHRKFYGTIVTQKLHRLNSDDFTSQPDKRTNVGMEILSSEIDFVNLLTGFKMVFFKPLCAAINSNRAIISLQNVEIIFTDILTILKIHGELCENLKNRFSNWNGSTSCIGDIFAKFTTRLSAYINLVNNVEAILLCIERVKETVPQFRAFLSRHVRRPEVKMMTFQEILYSPFERISEYTTLISWFQIYTPQSHPDRQYLISVIDNFSQLNDFISQTKIRLRREEELVNLKTKILNCPDLIEGNRHFLKQQDVFLLQPLSSVVVPDLRVYQCTELLSLYLFNDLLVISRRTSRYRPFCLAVDYKYRFVCSLKLQNLRVKNIANSRYVTNAFKLVSPSRKFYCCTTSYTEKIQWLNLLQQTIRAVSSS